MTAAAVSSTALYAAGLGLLFGVRSLQHRRATGTSGINLRRAHDPAAQLAVGCFAAAIGAGLFSPLLAHRRTRTRDTPASRLLGRVGLATAITGFGAAALAQQAMGASWRIGVDVDERTALVTDGVFGSVRNPIFTGMLLAQVGTALMAPTPLTVAGVAALLTGCEVQVRKVEEPYLARSHGPAYTAYAGRTGRFLPGIGRLTPRPLDTAAAAAA